MGQRTLLEYRPPPVAPGVTGAQPLAGGAGSAPVRGIEYREVYVDEIRGPARPFEMNVLSWSEYFRDALARELDRAGSSTTTGPHVHVEVRSLDVDTTFALGADTCRLVADVVVRAPSSIRTHRVSADGRAEKSHTCIGNAFAAMVRHIVASPWLAADASTASLDPVVTERARMLPDTSGRYGMQLGAQVGVGAVRTRGSSGASSELATSYGLVVDIPIRQDFFFTGSVHGELGNSGGVGVGFSFYPQHSYLVSASFLAGGGSRGTDLDVPALGGQLLLGRQWRVLPSLWLGVAARPFALWSLGEGRAHGVSLLTTITIN